MIYNYQSSQAIISKVFRDLNVTNQDWVTDAVEWIGEALQAIGANSQLEDAVLIRKTSSHKAKLPSDLYLLNEVRFGYFNAELDDQPKFEDFLKVMPYADNTLHPALVDSYRTETDANYVEETFFIRGGYVMTSFEEDWICMVYKRVAVDDDGFPMVPDLYGYSQALYWYIVMKLMERGWKHPSNEIGWQVSESRWLKYCVQARDEAKMPDIPKYEQFKRAWVRLIPNLNPDVNSLVADRTQAQRGRGGAYIVDEGNLERL